MAKGKQAFGGYAISFKGCKDTMEGVLLPQVRGEGKKKYQPLGVAGRPKKYP
jgi:hypothetical protein